MLLSLTVEAEGKLELSTSHFVALGEMDTVRFVSKIVKAEEW